MVGINVAPQGTWIRSRFGGYQDVELSTPDFQQQARLNMTFAKAGATF
jgi:hypothetical protein